MRKQLILTFIIVFLWSEGEAFLKKRQLTVGMGGMCPAGCNGCSCVCNCPTAQGCPNCPPAMGRRDVDQQLDELGDIPSMNTTIGDQSGEHQRKKRQNIGGQASPDTCFPVIRAAANQSTGVLLGLLLSTLLSNLVVPILQTVLAGNNTLEGAVIPVTNILCIILGYLLLTLRSLGLLGVLGLNGLLQNILGGTFG